MKSKYCNNLSRHLTVLAQPGVEGRDYVTAYEEFIDLLEQLEKAVDAGVVSETQRNAIEAVFDCIDKVGEDRRQGLVDYGVYVDDAFRESPTWQPMREAAQAAIKVLQG